ncbi:MAG: DUF547 domain-containing protein [Candidatus Dadabacteria bacterium]|nr:DUF547 domain-containing protein [Candidatus Dadabacteria bacterium]NIV41629.1 DUF547 domain-containing protein [Candidatus Dadabacteria bacterium]
MFAFGAADIVRQIGFLRNIFYPRVYERKGLGDETKGGKFDHFFYNKVLRETVNDSGYVDYTAISANPDNLELYIEQLTKSDTKNLSRYEHFALLVNAYNAYTLKLITEYPGIDSIKDISSDKRWKDKRWRIGEDVLSLDEIEHEILRKQYGDARIHFTLVCAAKSCPKLRNEPYTGDALIAQLDDQAVHFFSQEQNFRWDGGNNTVYLSELLDWFRGDFADNEKGALEYTLQYLDTETAGQIRTNIDSVKIKYIPYDWSLNGKWN